MALMTLFIQEFFLMLPDSCEVLCVDNPDRRLTDIDIDFRQDCDLPGFISVYIILAVEVRECS